MSSTICYIVPYSHCVPYIQTNFYINLLYLYKSLLGAIVLMFVLWLFLTTFITVIKMAVYMDKVNDIVVKALTYIL